MLDEEEVIPLQAPRSIKLGPHPGIPWAMFRREQVETLWRECHMTTYQAARVGLSPSQAAAVLECRQWRQMKEADARAAIDRAIARWRRTRCQ